jgi:hypothetical protein
MLETSPTLRRLSATKAGTPDGSSIEELTDQRARGSVALLLGSPRCLTV